MRKLASYCLDERHPHGRHKAIVFRKRLGLTPLQAFILRDALLQAARVEDTVLGVLDKHGQRYRVDFVMITGTGRCLIRSAWIIEGNNPPRLVSCIPRP